MHYEYENYTVELVSVRTTERKSVKFCTNSLQQVVPGKYNSATYLANIITASSGSQIELDLFCLQTKCKV